MRIPFWMLMSLVGLSAIPLMAEDGVVDSIVMKWDEHPKTYLAQKVFEKESQKWDEFGASAESAEVPKSLKDLHKFNNRLIVESNRWVEYFPYTLLINLIGIALLLIATHKQLKPPLILSFPISLTGTIGVILLFPNLNWKLTPALYAALVLTGSVSTFIGLKSILSSVAKKTKHKILYGPSLRTPQVKEGVEIGEYSDKVLPDNVRWASQVEEGPVLIPYQKLSQGIAILGDMGSGKTRLMMKIYDQIGVKFPNIPILIHDPKGEWYKSYFDPKTDLVFSPHVQNSSTWAILDDFKRHPELLYEVLNTAVYSRQNKEDVFWSDNAVNLLKSAFNQGSLESAISHLSFLKEKNGEDRFFMSVLGTARLALNDIVKIETDCQSKKTSGPGKSIDDYLNHKGRIFLLNNPAFAAEQKGAFNLFLSMFFLRAISQEDTRPGELRAAAIVDEILSFNMPPDVCRRVFTISRSKGLAIVSAAQRIPKERRGEMTDWLNSEYLFGMKVMDMPTQEYLSKKSGALHYEMQIESKTKAAGGKGSKTNSQQIQREKFILEGHFSRLQTKEFILFHQDGITPGRAMEVIFNPRSIELPKYVELREVEDHVKVLD